MYLRIVCFILVASAFFMSCSSETKEKTPAAPSKELVKEVKSLDSLNQNIEKSTTDIEESIQSVEEAVKEISNF